MSSHEAQASGADGPEAEAQHSTDELDERVVAVAAALRPAVDAAASIQTALAEAASRQAAIAEAAAIQPALDAAASIRTALAEAASTQAAVAEAAAIQPALDAAASIRTALAEAASRQAAVAAAASMQPALDAVASFQAHQARLVAAQASLAKIRDPLRQEIGELTQHRAFVMPPNPTVAAVRALREELGELATLMEAQATTTSAMLAGIEELARIGTQADERDAREAAREARRDWFAIVLALALVVLTVLLIPGAIDSVRRLIGR